MNRLSHWARSRARALPLGDKLAQWYWRRLATRPGPFRGSSDYWETPYRMGGASGAGSYGRLATFKAGFLNDLVRRYAVQSVIEFGCGDGHQLSLAAYPQYLGFDVSPAAVDRCRERFTGDVAKRFCLVDDYAGETAELCLSLDVIYHLVEDAVFETYMVRLFQAADQIVVIYSSDTDDNRRSFGGHVRHRRFSRWIHERRPDWTLAEHVPNPYPYAADDPDTSFAEFFVFVRGGLTG